MTTSDESARARARAGTRASASDHDHDRSLRAIDHLLFHRSVDPHAQAIAHWYNAQVKPHAPIMEPSYYRMQIERFIFDSVRERQHAHVAKGGIGVRIYDIGQHLAPRTWLAYEDDAYRTVGLAESGMTPDIECDLLRLSALHPVSFEGPSIIICAEVLEHCTDPARALREMHATLAPGGILLATAPFMWADHATPAYDDYFRFTAGGWRLLLSQAGFSEDECTISSVRWTFEGGVLYDLLRRFECFGMRQNTSAQTGFMVRARKQAREPDVE